MASHNKNRIQKSRTQKTPHKKLLYSAAQVREIDRIAIEECGIPGINLMKRAGEACVNELVRRWPGAGHVVVMCGNGNNAGDGFIVAGLLADRNIKATAMLVGREPAAGTDAGLAFEFCKASAARIETAAGNLRDELRQADVVVDALLGTGLTGELRKGFAEAIGAVNSLAVPVLSVDVPSGLCADTGRILGQAIDATVTVTFIGRKLGLFTNDGPEVAGDVALDRLGVPEAVLEKIPASQAVACLDHDAEILALPRRRRNAHKGSHGHLVVVGGNEGMGGAALMAGEAALMCGAGLVSVATHAANVAAITARRPELMARAVNSADDLSALLEAGTALVLGPGLGCAGWSRMAFEASVASGLPMVIDADGLNLLSQLKKLPALDACALTPHPGEARRMLGGVDIQEDRRRAVVELREKYGAAVLLKGAGTLIADSSGVSLCPYGNPGMAAAGMGDVLSGVVGGLMSQGLAAASAARLGAVVHSKAADELALRQGERGMMATELLPGIRRLLNNAPAG